MVGDWTVVWKEPAPIRNAADEMVERLLFEEFRGQQELDSERENRL